MMVRNEEDIVADSICHLFNQNVDVVVVVDNGSTDNTLEILRELAVSFPLIIGKDLEPRYFQAAKMTLLGRWAAAGGAEWIIPVDADEFWFAAEGSLGGTLRSCHANVARADIYNVFPGPEGMRLDLRPHDLRKVAYRPSRWALLDTGNHWVSRAGTTANVLRVAHFPWRGKAQLDAKMRQGGAAIRAANLTSGVGAHWREDVSEQDLAQIWNFVSGGDRTSISPVDTASGWWPHGPFITADPRIWKTWPVDLSPLTGEQI